MSIISSDRAILIIEELQTKFDLGVVSNSLIKLLDSYLEARIVQQLHYWTVKEYGKVIEGLRWIYKPIREWLSEAIIGFTSWQLRKAIASLVKKGILLREHLFKEHHGSNFAPKNRTYYYSLNYEGLEEYAEKHKMAETTENIRFVSDTNQFCESSEKQFCEKAKNKTKNTSIENLNQNKSHPTLPCECESFEEGSQEKQELSNSELLKMEEVNSVYPTVIEQEVNVGSVDENVNQNVITTPDIVSKSVEPPKVKSKTPKGTKPNRKRRNQAPWSSDGEFKRFYRALIQALPIVANARSPQGLAQTIIRQLRAGIPHSYWDDFAAGVPIGTSTKPEWEIAPGEPYPMFVEYLTEKLKAGNNTKSDEQTRNEVFYLLNQPRQAKAFWGQFKRSVVNVSTQVERDRALGVSSPNTPTWTRERIEPSIEEAAAAGKKIMAVSGDSNAAIASASTKSQSLPSHPTEIPDPWIDDQPQPSMRELLTKKLGKLNLKGFVKTMPKMSKSEVKAEERQAIKPKTHISQMSVDEINDYLADPVLRAQIMPQLWHSEDYELIQNDYGEIIKVKRRSSTSLGGNYEYSHC